MQPKFLKIWLSFHFLYFFSYFVFHSFVMLPHRNPKNPINFHQAESLSPPSTQRPRGLWGARSWSFSMCVALAVHYATIRPSRAALFVPVRRITLGIKLYGLYRKQRNPLKSESALARSLARSPHQMCRCGLKHKSARRRVSGEWVSGARSRPSDINPQNNYLRALLQNNGRRRVRLCTHAVHRVLNTSSCGYTYWLLEGLESVEIFRKCLVRFSQRSG